MDENQNVPALVGEHADLAAEAAEQARQNALHAGSTADQEVSINYPTNSYTTMAVVDGIVISPPVHNLTFTQFTMANCCLALCL
jgi:hypothetical protein